MNDSEQNGPPPPNLYEPEPKDPHQSGSLKVVGALIGILTAGIIVLVNLPKGNSDENLKPNIPVSPHSSLNGTSSDQPLSTTSTDTWLDLLGENLSAWQAWLGAPHHSVNLPGSPASASGAARPPIGSNDPIGVFSLTSLDGTPTLKVSGEVPGGLITKSNYRNYHFTTRFKWGNKLWPKIAIGKRDSGILVHCHGEPGTMYDYWMPSLEYQLRKGMTGSAWFLDASGKSPAEKNSSQNSSQTYLKFNLSEPLQSTDRVVYQAHGTNESSGWNKVDIYTLGSTLVFMLNGKVTVIIDEMRTKPSTGRKLITEGKILLQSASAEIFFQDTKIRRIDELPSSLQAKVDLLR